MFQILLKASTGALILLNENNPDLFDYVSDGFSPVFEKSKNKNVCLRWIDDYWSENEVKEEEQIFCTLN